MDISKYSHTQAAGCPVPVSSCFVASASGSGRSSGGPGETKTADLVGLDLPFYKDFVRLMGFHYLSLTADEKLHQKNSHGIDIVEHDAHTLQFIVNMVLPDGYSQTQANCPTPV